MENGNGQVNGRQQQQQQHCLCARLWVQRKEDGKVVDRKNITPVRRPKEGSGGILEAL